MGSGKSTVGLILAERLIFLFIDLDTIIELYEDMAIPEIFKKYGEKHFRDTESAVIAKVYRNKGCVFSCGGGVVLRSKNIKIIRKNSYVVHLDVSEEGVFNRLKTENTRPLLAGDDKKEKIGTLIRERKELYRNNCDLSINTDENTPEEIADYIIQKIKNYTPDR